MLRRPMKPLYVLLIVEVVGFVGVWALAPLIAALLGGAPGITYTSFGNIIMALIISLSTNLTMYFLFLRKNAPFRQQ